jgi:hypothetical protein
MTDLAKQMWDAYAKQAGGVTFDGKPLPDWDGLGEDRQSCWVAAAKVAADRIEHLERDLAYERYSRESAATKAWEFAQRIKVLEEALRKIEKDEHDFGTLWSTLVARAALEDKG